MNKQIQDLRAERMNISAKDVQITGELHNWHREPIPGKDYIVIWGDIVGDTAMRFRDGERVRTSIVIKVEDDIALTLNSAYRLMGEEKAVPNVV